MSTTPPPSPGQSPRRVRKRILVPVVLLGLLLLAFVGLYVRGTWADSAEKDPTSPEQGAVTQLYRTPDGHSVVRCAVLVDAPPGAVWAVINDYPSHASFLPYVRSLSASPGPGGKTHVEGVVESPVYGTWPFESDVTNTADPAAGRYEASWDESGGEFTRNAGRWELRPAGPGRTLVAFVLDVEPKKYPSFFVRNVLMDRVHQILLALREEVRRRRA